MGFCLFKSFKDLHKTFTISSLFCKYKTNICSILDRSSGSKNNLKTMLFDIRRLFKIFLICNPLKTSNFYPKNLQKVLHLQKNRHIQKIPLLHIRRAFNQVTLKRKRQYMTLGSGHIQKISILTFLCFLYGKCTSLKVEPPERGSKCISAYVSDRSFHLHISSWQVFHIFCPSSVYGRPIIVQEFFKITITLKNALYIKSFTGK